VKKPPPPAEKEEMHGGRTSGWFFNKQRKKKRGEAFPDFRRKGEQGEQEKGGGERNVRPHSAVGKKKRRGGPKLSPLGGGGRGEGGVADWGEEEMKVLLFFRKGKKRKVFIKELFPRKGGTPFFSLSKRERKKGT